MSPWGSYAFATRDSAFGRARRVVDDYRRTNRHSLRIVYYIRHCDGIEEEAAGTVWHAGCDGAKGYNLWENTQAARGVLAVLSQGGCRLPSCLQLGPRSGPFGSQFPVDTGFVPPPPHPVRLGREWKNYLDDFFICAGRLLDGRAISSKQYSKEVVEAIGEPPPPHPISEALDAAGFRRVEVRDDRGAMTAGELAAAGLTREAGGGYNAGSGNGCFPVEKPRDGAPRVNAQGKRPGGRGARERRQKRRRERKQLAVLAAAPKWWSKKRSEEPTRVQLRGDQGVPAEGPLQIFGSRG